MATVPLLVTETRSLCQIKKIQILPDSISLWDDKIYITVDMTSSTKFGNTVFDKDTASNSDAPFLELFSKHILITYMMMITFEQ